MGWIVSVKLKGKFEIGQFGLTKKQKQNAIKDFESMLNEFFSNLSSYAKIDTDGEIEATWEDEG